MASHPVCLGRGANQVELVTVFCPKGIELERRWSGVAQVEMIACEEFPSRCSGEIPKKSSRDQMGWDGVYFLKSPLASSAVNKIVVRTRVKRRDQRGGWCQWPKILQGHKAEAHFLTHQGQTEHPMALPMALV